MYTVYGYKFQFHKGTIKTALLVVYHPQKKNSIP